MKPLRTLALIVLATIHLSEAFRLRAPQFIQDVFNPPSRIPQFIRDSKHPWLEQNIKTIERLGNPASSLCDLDSPLRPNNGSGNGTSVNGLDAYPADFFTMLKVTNDWGYNSASAGDVVEGLLDCPAALHDVTNLTIAFRWSDDPSLKDGQISPFLSEALLSMPHLQNLNWEKSWFGDETVCKTLTESNFTMPLVKELRLGHRVNCLVGLCLNVQVLTLNVDVGPWDYHGAAIFPGSELGALLANDMSNLTHFGMTTRWHVDHLKELFLAAPNLTSLGIDGKIRREHDVWSSYEDYDIGYEFVGSQNATLEGFANLLASFPKLKHLTLPPVSGLDLGYGEGPFCGNVYFGCDGREYGRQRSRLYAKNMEFATEIILSKLPHLSELAIGEWQLNLTMNEEGQYNISWPWTGRLQEWLYEQFPLEETWPGEDAQN